MRFISPLVSFLLAIIVGAVVVILVGENPFRIYQIMFLDTVQNVDDITNIFFNATPLIFTGLSVAFAFKCGLFNIGAEGQLYIATFLCALVGFSFTNLPAVIHVPLCIVSAMIGGAIWGAIPGYLKAKFGVHEVINTIMLNAVAIKLTNYLVTNVYQQEGQMIPHTKEIALSAHIPRIHDIWSSISPGNPLNISIIFALITAGIIYVVMKDTRFGYEIRAVGTNKDAAEYGGIDAKKIIIITMTISGAIAGLVGVNEVMGYRHRFLDNFSSGYGFMGIAVALLGKNHPLGIILSALLIALLNVGAINIGVFTKIPREFVVILQSIIIIFLVVSNELIDRFVKVVADFKSAGT